MLFLLLLGELLALYFISRWVTQSVFTLFLLIFRTRSIALPVVLVLEFPGTVIHELSHLFTAEILGVRTGKLRLEPESIRGQQIKTGSVAIAQSDPFRRYMIGLAPIVWGMVVLAAIAYFIPQVPAWGVWGLGYLLFAVSNTMFSSPDDLKGFLPFAVVLTIISGTAYFVGMRIIITGQVLEVVIRLLTTLTQSLGIVLIVNVVLLLVTKCLTALLSRLFHVRIVSDRSSTK